jgi:hypothetical protein
VNYFNVYETSKKCFSLSEKGYACTHVHQIQVSKIILSFCYIYRFITFLPPHPNQPGHFFQKKGICMYGCVCVWLCASIDGEANAHMEFILLDHVDHTGVGLAPTGNIGMIQADMKKKLYDNMK